MKNIGGIMKYSSQAVAAEITHHRTTLAFSIRLNSMTNIT